MEFKDITKEFLEKELRQKSLTYLAKEILEEVDKCELLCSNCHREVHFQELNHPILKEIINESSSREYV